MAVLRKFNALGQMRVDVPHLRAIESAISADFDVLAGRVMAGGKPLVVKGFSVANQVLSGISANDLQINTADGIVINLNASEGGSFLWVPADRPVESLSPLTNLRVQGAWTDNATNYVSIDFIRKTDPTTVDLVKFSDPTTGSEISKSVALGRTLDYVIVISTAPFSLTPSLIPICKVVIGSSLSVTSVQDARNMAFRVTNGGDLPGSTPGFTWPGGRALSNANSFTGGDKQLSSSKEFQDAVMTRLWELGGGAAWFSPTADRNVRMCRELGGSPFTNGDNFEWVPGSGGVNHLHWYGLSIVFDNSTTGYYNEISDQVTDDLTVSDVTRLGIGDCIYVDLDRTQNLTGVNALVVKRAPLVTLGTPFMPGSRYVLAWRAATGDVLVRDTSLPVGYALLPATTTSIGAVKLAYTPGSLSQPIVLPLTSYNGITIGTGGAPTVTTDYGIDLLVSGTAAGIRSLSGGSGTALIASNTSTGRAISSTSANANETLLVTNTGAGKAIEATSAGTTPTIRATNSSTGAAIDAINSGGGFAVSATSTGTAASIVGSGSSTSAAISNSSTGKAMTVTAVSDYAIDASVSGNGNTVRSIAAGTGTALIASNTGTGRAISSTSANSNETVLIGNTGTGRAITASSAGASTTILATNTSTGVALAANNTGGGTAFSATNSTTSLAAATAVNSSSGRGLTVRNTPSADNDASAYFDGGPVGIARVPSSSSASINMDLVTYNGFAKQIAIISSSYVSGWQNLGGQNFALISAATGTSVQVNFNNAITNRPMLWSVRSTEASSSQKYDAAVQVVGANAVAVSIYDKAGVVVDNTVLSTATWTVQIFVF